MSEINLTGKYLKLANDLTKAVEAARMKVPSEDGGTCNFDSLMLYLPRWEVAKVKLAAEAAGIFASKCYGYKSTFTFSVPVGAQGYARTRQAEVMDRVMKDLGYDSGVFYMMD